MADTERHWNTPTGFQSAVDSAVPLPQIYNSLKDSKQTLVPVGGPRSRQLTWYECGPTVYDSAHMGHARNYVTFDIVRRILKDYFGYSILYVMNVTDVDDKIIRRAKRNYLLQQYQTQHTDPSQVDTVMRCFPAFTAENILKNWCMTSGPIRSTISAGRQHCCPKP